MLNNIEHTITAVRIAGNLKAKELCAKYGTDYAAFTDGSSDNVRGHEGGAAYIIFDNNGGYVTHNSKGFTDTTNNRMEILAILSAVCSIPEGKSITIITDSYYAINSLKREYECYDSNGDIIHNYFRLRKDRRVVFKWVKGHKDNTGNEIVDELSTRAMRKIRDNKAHFAKPI